MLFSIAPCLGLLAHRRVHSLAAINHTEEFQHNSSSSASSKLEKKAKNKVQEKYQKAKLCQKSTFNIYLFQQLQPHFISNDLQYSQAVDHLGLEHSRVLECEKDQHYMMQVTNTAITISKSFNAKTQKHNFPNM